MAWLARQAVEGRQLAILFSARQQLGLHRVSSLLVKLFPTPPCSICQRHSNSSPSASVKVSNSCSEFRSIYSFRFIVHTRVLSRLKIYQTLLTLGAIPPAAAMHNAGMLSAPGLASFFGIASVATAMLYVMSNLFRHVVGMISVNEKEDVVRISHLTFWGKRRDNDFDVSSIVPLSDMSVKANDVYQVIHFYDRPVKFYWFLQHAKNADHEAIERIFGRF